MALLVILFILLPIAEIYVIVKVGEAIGILPTLAILVLDGFLGAAIARSQGRAAWIRFNRALAEGRMPGREAFDGAMIIVGGAFLLAPGFITDVIGLVLILPPTRAAFRGLIARMARRRMTMAPRVIFFGGSARGPAPPPYDVEGTARDAEEPDRELPSGERDG